MSLNKGNFTSSNLENVRDEIEVILQITSNGHYYTITLQ